VQLFETIQVTSQARLVNWGGNSKICRYRSIASFSKVLLLKKKTGWVIKGRSFSIAPRPCCCEATLCTPPQKKNLWPLTFFFEEGEE
jgi:hypothetical protein